MNLSGIAIKEDVSKQWQALRVDESVGAVKFIVNDKDTFEIVGQAGSSSDNTEVAAGMLEAKKACYVLVRNGDKFFLIFYVPLNAHVREKMIYSSALNSLRLGLGSENLLSTVSITEPRECTAKHVQNSLVASRDSTMTVGERMDEVSYLEAHSNLDTHAAVIADLPIKIHEGVDVIFEKFVSGAVNAMIIKLDVENEELQIQQDFKTADLPTIVNALEEVEPRFILSKVQGPDYSGNTMDIVSFIYYCPEKAKIRPKMVYSSSKSVVLKTLEKFNIVRKSNFETSDKTDINLDHIIRDAFPPKVEKIIAAKPKPRGKGTGSLGAKFSDF